MKISLLLAVSLAVNLALVVVFLKRAAPAPAAAALGGADPGAAQVPEAGDAPPAKPEVQTPAAAGESRDPGATLKRVADWMRHEGHPTGAMQIVLAVLAQFQMRDRLKESGISIYADPAEFWKRQVNMFTPTPGQAEMRREIEKETMASLNAALGSDFAVSEDERRRVGYGLSDETTNQLLDVIAKHRQLTADAQASGMPREEISLKLTQIQNERRTAIEGLLTPEQLQEFDLRMGAGNGLHNRLGAFVATEAEFRALHAAQKALFEGNPAGMSLAPAALAQFEPELRRVLGETRYAELLAANEKRDQMSRTFGEMRQVFDGLKLPLDATSRVIPLVAEFQPQLAALEENTSLNAAQKAARRAELGKEARRELLRALGPDGFEAYEKAKGGWLPPVE